MDDVRSRHFLAEKCGSYTHGSMERTTAAALTSTVHAYPFPSPPLTARHLFPLLPLPNKTQTTRLPFQPLLFQSCIHCHTRARASSSARASIADTQQQRSCLLGPT